MSETVLNLSHEEKQYLLRIAREAIATAFEGQRYTPPPPPTEKLKEHYGVFVTLTIDGNLRGCIGLVEGIKPLYEGVADMAIAAAFEDPRFPPLQPDELPKVTIEISVLSPLKRIRSVDEIQVGKHGLLIQSHGNRGLLLPQVAVEYGWDEEVFLSQTCIKAGMPGDCWQHPDTEIYVFSAEIFDEKELAGEA